MDPVKLRAHLLGPARDLYRCGAGKHGSLRVEDRTLLFVGDDGRQVSLTLDRGGDILTLANELRRAWVAEVEKAVKDEG